MYPQLYHAHHKTYTEDLPFWFELAEQQGGPILELGCGTGRVLLQLAQSGYMVTGVDIDPEMLAELRRNLPYDLQPQPDLIEADIARFELEPAFHLAILPCNTLSTLPDADRQAAFHKVSQALVPGGIFAASVPNTPSLLKLPAVGEPEVEDVFEHPLIHEPVMASSAWERTEEFFTVFWIYDVLYEDGRVERLTAQTNHHLTPLEMYREELAQAGLVVEAMYGDFDKRKYRKNSPNLILVARKLAR